FPNVASQQANDVSRSISSNDGLFRSLSTGEVIAELSRAVSATKTDECSPRPCVRPIFRIHRKWNNQSACRANHNCKRFYGEECRLAHFGLLRVCAPYRRTCSDS